VGLVRCRGVILAGGLIGLRFADDDLSAVERQEVELQVEAVAVAMSPCGPDLAPVAALAVLVTIPKHAS